MDTRRLIVTISTLTVSQLWASGSSFVLFAIAARTLVAAELGTLVLLLACSQLITFLSDGGLTAYVVRDAARSESLSVLHWSLRRRALLVLAVTVPASLLILDGPTPGVVLLVAAASMANSWYSAVISALFVVGEPRRVAVVQVLNGVLFISLGLVAASFGRGPTAFLLAVLASYCTLLVWELRTLRAILAEPVARPALRGQVPFIVTGLADGITSVVDSLALGRQSTVALAGYAAAQRAALGLNAATRAASGLLLPAFSRRPTAPRVLVVASASVAAVLVGSALALLLTPLSNALYGGDLADRRVMTLLCGAYALDLVLGLVTVNLVARGQEQPVAVVAALQLTATTAGVLVLLPQGPVGVAFAVAAGRVTALVVLLFIQVRLADRPLQG